jgi:hypothetical protein
VEEVSPEAAGADLRVEVPRGREEEPDFGPPLLLVSQAPVAAGVDDPEELPLGLEGRAGDLIVRKEAVLDAGTLPAGIRAGPIAGGGAPDLAVP